MHAELDKFLRFINGSENKMLVLSVLDEITGGKTNSNIVVRLLEGCVKNDNPDEWTALDMVAISDELKIDISDVLQARFELKFKNLVSARYQGDKTIEYHLDVAELNKRIGL